MRTVRFCHGKVDYLTIDIVCVVSTPSEVDELVRCYEIAWFDFLLQAPNHASGHNMAYPQRPNGPEICLVRHFVWRDGVIRTVSWQEYYSLAFKLTNREFFRWFAVGSVHFDLSYPFDGRKTTEPRPADDTNTRFVPLQGLPLPLSGTWPRRAH